MASQSPYKLLEINLISARDLPPLAKTLRTFAVAYVTPDNKVTTIIDHNGHTNPTWNHKMQFHVEVEYLKQESPTLTIEIYNLAWLRHLPIGTAQLNLNTFLSLPPRKNGSRRVSLQVCRPNGHLKGTVHLTALFSDVVVPEDDIISPSITPGPDENLEIKKIECICSESETRTVTSAEVKYDPERGLYRANENQIFENWKETGDIDRNERIPGLDSDTASTSSCSNYSFLRPVPPEDLKRGFLRKKAASEYGSDIFENWTVVGEISSDDKVSGLEITQYSESFCSTPESMSTLSRSTLRPDSEPDTTIVTPGHSDYNMVRPLAPEVANDLKIGYYMAKAADSRSENFDNLTEAGDNSSDVKIPDHEITPYSEGSSSTQERSSTMRPDSEPEITTITSGSSDYNLVRPLLPEEADKLKLGYYRTKAAESESENFENWTERGDNSSDVKSACLEITPYTESFCSKLERISTLRRSTLMPNSEPETATVTSGSSDYSMVRPLPPDVADDLRMGYIRAKAAESQSENWTEVGGNSSDVKSAGLEITSYNESFCSTPERTSLLRPDSEHETKTITSGSSDYSLVRPLPPEVVDNLRMGYIRAKAAESHSDWTEVGDNCSDVKSTGPKITPYNESFCSTPESTSIYRRSTLRPDSEHETTTITSGSSDYSLVRPLPPEMADNLRMGYIRAKAAESQSDWTEVGDDCSDVKSTGPKITPYNESFCSTPESKSILRRTTLRPDSEHETTTITSGSSDYSLVRPLPPEMADNLRMGYIRAKAAESQSDWTEAGDDCSDVKSTGLKIPPYNESFCSTLESRSTSRPNLEHETTTVTSGGSDYSLVRPLPPEVADNLRIGYYKAKAAESQSENFDNWTEAGDNNSDVKSPGLEGTLKNNNISSAPESTLRPDSEHQTRTITSASSDYCLMRPLPPNVADNLRRWYYKAKAAESSGSENWTEVATASSDDKNPGQQKNDNFCSTPESISTLRPDSEPEVGTVASGEILDYSLMRPLPPEVVDDMKKVFHKAEAADYRSMICTWKEAGGMKNQEIESKPEKVELKAEGVNNIKRPTMNELPLDLRRKRPQKPAMKRFKIFGLQFGFICGSNKMRPKNKKRDSKGVQVKASSGEKLGKFYG